MHLHPLLAAWLIAAFIRVCLGSATVAGLTAAGMIAPMIAGTTINPSLIVLATGAGSLLFSHVNDSGFWLFKEYFNLTVKETLENLERHGIHYIGESDCLWLASFIFLPIIN